MELLGFIHTSHGNRSLVAARLRRTGVDRHVLHRVNERLLDGPWPSLEERDRTIDKEIARLGRLGAGRIICTCTTIASVAEESGRRHGVATTRVDRPLMRAAAARGGRIAVVIATPTTRSSSLTLLHDELANVGGRGTVTPIDIPAAWSNFRAGRVELYLEQVAAAARDALADHDLVVLAQLSMAPAAESLGPAVLTSLEFLMADVMEFMGSDRSARSELPS